MKEVIVAIALLAMASAVQAEGIDAKRLYAGGGFGFNSLPGTGSARGFQFFGGYEFAFKLNDDITSALEIGYMDSGKFDQLNASPQVNAAKGVWFSMLESVPLTSKTDMLARLGYDFGDDDGLLFGAGMQYRFDTKVAMRTEYIAREHVNSLQVNLLVKF